MAYIGKTPTPAPLTSSDVTDGIITTAKIADGIEVVDWQSVETGATFTAVAGNGYPVNTTAQACTVTLPAGSVGDTIEFVDYAGTWDTNNVTLTADGSEKIKGSTDDGTLSVERQGIKIVYVDATQGWVAATGVNDNTAPAINPPSYEIEYLVVAGGGGSAFLYGGGGGAGGYRNSFGSETSGRGASTETVLTATSGTQYTITIGAGGAAATDYSGSASEKRGSTGSDSSISGSGITTVTSAGGGYGDTNLADGGDGGCGGGAGSSGARGDGTANQGYDGGDASTNGNGYGGGGGGGAGAVGGDSASNSGTGGDGGAGLASSITGSAVTRGGGGGGGSPGDGTVGAAGTGGGGTNGGNGTANTGGGGGASKVVDGSGDGGSGVVILRIPDASYSGTTTGSPTIDTSSVADETILIFNADGSYTG